MPYTQNTYLIVILSFLSFFITELSAQSYRSTNKSVGKAVSIANVDKKPKAFKSKVSAYRFHKRLSGTHTGYTIEIGQSDRPLERKDPLFRQFGNVYYHKMTNGIYSYLITTEFHDKKSYEKFYRTVILPRNANAKMIEYKLGKRHEF